MKVKVFIEEVETVKIYTSNYPAFDSIVLDDNLEMQLGKDGVKGLIQDLMWQLQKKYGEDELVDILHDQDFNGVRELLVEKEVKDLDSQIRELKEEKRQLKGNLDISLNLVKTYQNKERNNG